MKKAFKKIRCYFFGCKRFNAVVLSVNEERSDFDVLCTCMECNKKQIKRLKICDIEEVQTIQIINPK